MTARIARRCAIGAFTICSALALVGADFPPPAGFLWLAAIFAVLAVVVRIRVAGRLAARAVGRRVAPAALEGLIAGFLVAATLLVCVPVDPGVVPTLIDRAVWFAVLGGAGAVTAQFIWAAALVMWRRAQPASFPLSTG